MSSIDAMSWIGVAGTAASFGSLAYGIHEAEQGHETTFDEAGIVGMIAFISLVILASELQKRSTSKTLRENARD